MLERLHPCSSAGPGTDAVPADGAAEPCLPRSRGLDGVQYSLLLQVDMSWNGRVTALYSHNMRSIARPFRVAYLFERCCNFIGARGSALCLKLSCKRQQHYFILSLQNCLRAMQAALQHRLERRAAALAPVREAFRLAEGPKQGPMLSPAGGAAASAPARSLRGVLSEAQFGAFCALINPAIKPYEVAVLLAAMAPGGARQACTRGLMLLSAVMG